MRSASTHKKRRVEKRTIPMNGREYFDRWERKLHIADLDPASLREDLPPLELAPGPTQSRVGGRITTDLKRPGPEETAERRERSETFLHRPRKYFPAEEAATKKDIRTKDIRSK